MLTDDSSSILSKLGCVSRRYTDFVIIWLGLVLVFVFLKRHGWYGLLFVAGLFGSEPVLVDGVKV